VEPVFALEPCPSVTVVLAPLVQVTLTVPVPFSGAVAFVTMGSYAPKATGAVEIEQLAETEADTARFAVCVAASVVVTAPTDSKRAPVRDSVRAENICLIMLTPIRGTESTCYCK
jgi:acyl-CoA hydrolase